MPIPNERKPAKQLTAAELGAELEEIEQAEKIRPAMREPQRSGRLSDAEILQMYGDEFQDTYYIDPSIVPPGQVYGWKALDGILGKPDPAGMARKLRDGWTPVDAERHPGIWTMKGAKGPIVHEGLTLCERSSAEDYNRNRYFYLLAKNQVRDKMRQLNEAPAGDYKRDHNAVRPRIERGSFDPISAGSEIE